ncbi:hypothetical protein H0H81_010639 [Sphagnurus paluster]|uniref:Uncharacterized protein n=1 Tax=Sphagnurus paluster TaxID=117069 RepID=A0A9P7KJN6_9AGAR|nr:hypothetical protein H0H81_010639 [Sphagnurus paluster]
MADIDRRDQVIFEVEGIRTTGLSLPRQHSLVHYKEVIQLFGSPNGLCLSITESKHIKAVKEPWRCSNHFNVLGQMLLTNQRLDKLAVVRVDFTNRWMLDGPILPFGHILPLTPATNDEDNIYDNNISDGTDDDSDDEGHDEDNNDDNVVSGPRVLSEVILARTPGILCLSTSNCTVSDQIHSARGYPRSLNDISVHFNLPMLPRLIREFLHDQLYLNSAIPALDQPGPDLISLPKSLKIFHSAIAEFYAPSDASGIGGMRRERIQATPSWRHGPPRNDCLLATKDPSLYGMRGLFAARVVLFFSFRLKHDEVIYPCALVQGFSPIKDEPCHDTGMWIVERNWDDDGLQSMTVIHLDSITRGTHLIPVFGEDFIGRDITYSNSLDHFNEYYDSKFADHHIYEIAF